MQKIYLVDDDIQLLNLYKLVLERAGYQVITEADGAQALSTLKLKSFDIILLDIMLPNANGINILKSIKQEDNVNKLTPIILFSNLIDDQTMKFAQELGVIKFLTKIDTTPQQLVEIIKQSIGS